MKHVFALLAATSAVGVGGYANAATLIANYEPNKPLEILNTNEDPDNKADISIIDGKAGYQGIGGNINSNTTGEPAPVSGLFGDGTVVDYRFVQGPADKNISLELITYASGSAGRISTIFATDAANIAGNQSMIQVWESSDPGTGFGGGSQVVPANPADYTSNTMAGLADGGGTIDITNMTDGQIYFIAGGYGGTERLTLTMSGPGQPDIIVQGDGSWPRPNRVHLHDWSFENADLLYDTITWNFYHADRDGSAARFGGVVLDGNVVPEPGSLALLGLGGLLIARRRRGASCQ